MAKLKTGATARSTTADANVETDVLIVGAGPVGLFLANECARRRLRFRLVEARARQSEHSKALAVMPRSMEIFEMAGISAPFLREANRVTSIAMVNSARTLARMSFEPDETPYPFVAMVPQDVTERLLVKELRRKGCEVEYNTAFVSAVEQPDGVSALLEHRGEQLEIRASYVVGCDGAHSAVRHLLSLPFQGKTYDASFMLADMETNEALPDDEMQLCPSEHGPLAIFPMSSTRRRLVATVPTADEEQPSIELVQRLLAQRGPSELQIRSIHWSSYFRVHHRQVSELRVGRIFLAGDAAHIHSPIGGQGMNTGLQDVWNLAWKLDFAIRGKASRLLIDSYNTERTPAIRRVIEMTDLMTRGLGTASKLAESARDIAIPLLFRIPTFRNTMVQRLSQLGLSYSGSPIVKNGGQRYWDETLSAARALGSNFLLLLGSGTDESTKLSAQRLAEEMDGVLEIGTSLEERTRLVRPDGYLAYQGADGREAIAAAEWLLRAITSPDDDCRRGEAE